VLHLRTPTAESDTICAVVAACGGCPHYAVTADEERAKKLAGVGARLTEALGMAFLVEWVPSPTRTGYRNRVRLRVDADGRVAFFNEHKQTSCVALAPSLRVAVDRVRAISEIRASSFAVVHHVEVRVPDRHGRASVLLVARGNAGDANPAREALRSEFLVAIAGRERDGEATTQDYDVVDGVFARVPLGRFMQVNSSVNTLLTGEVVRRARSSGATTAADLFAGSGNFALPLSASGIRTVAVEVDQDAVQAMRDAAREQSLVVDAIAADAMTQAAAWSEEGRTFDLVLADAPRAGLKSRHAALAKIARQTIALCSCNTRTFAADAARIVELGFRLTSVTAFDMFPGTEHLELLGWFQR
jgi:23S rRNA (uracil1939-C5)-methyltransferase